MGQGWERFALLLVLQIFIFIQFIAFLCSLYPLLAPVAADRNYRPTD